MDAAATAKSNFFMVFLLNSAEGVHGESIKLKNSFYGVSHAISVPL
jgi:hypothetical protein